MALDRAENGAGRSARISPKGIAHNPLFTPRERLDLLEQLRAEIAAEDEIRLGFGAAEVDRAIEELKHDVQNGQGSEAAMLARQH